MPLEHPSAGLCLLAISKAEVAAKCHVQYPWMVSGVPVTPRREMPWEDKSKNTVISLLAIRKQEINAVLFPSTLKCMICNSPSPCSTISASFPTSNYYQNISPLVESKLLETQGPSREHSAQIFHLISLTTELANKWHNEKASVRYPINSQNPASNQGSFNQRRQKPMCLSKTELFLSWFVVNLWAEPIFQGPSPTLSCLDRKKKSAPTNTKQMAFDFSQVLSTHGSH